MSGTVQTYIMYVCMILAVPIPDQAMQVLSYSPDKNQEVGRGGAGMGSTLASAPASTARPRVHQPNQLDLYQQYIHLVEVKYCEDTKPENQLEAAKQQHRDLN